MQRSNLRLIRILLRPSVVDFLGHERVFRSAWVCPARLLQYTFPLIPNELGVAEKEHELTRQLRLLRETLEDRLAGGAAVGRAHCAAIPDMLTAATPVQ